jgi:hypothetical protein
VTGKGKDRKGAQEWIVSDECTKEYKSSDWRGSTVMGKGEDKERGARVEYMSHMMMINRCTKVCKSIENQRSKKIMIALKATIK